MVSKANKQYYLGLVDTFEVTGHSATVKDSTGEYDVQFVAANAKGMWIALPTITSSVTPLGFIEWQKIHQLIVNKQNSDLWVMVDSLQDFEISKQQTMISVKSYVHYVLDTGEIAIRLLGDFCDRNVIDYLDKKGKLKYLYPEELPKVNSFSNVNKAMVAFIILEFMFAGFCVIVIKATGLTNIWIWMAIAALLVFLGVRLARRVYSKHTGISNKKIATDDNTINDTSGQRTDLAIQEDDIKQEEIIELPYNYVEKTAEEEKKYLIEHWIGEAETLIKEKGSEEYVKYTIKKRSHLNDSEVNDIYDKARANRKALDKYASYAILVISIIMFIGSLNFVFALAAILIAYHLISEKKHSSKS